MGPSMLSNWSSKLHSQIEWLGITSPSNPFAQTTTDRKIIMPRFRIEALEKFVVRTVYFVDADDPEQAEALCKSSQIAYEQKTIEEGDEEWLETVSVEPIG